jgi:hypothetical protein
VFGTLFKDWNSKELEVGGPIGFEITSELPPMVIVN